MIDNSSLFRYSAPYLLAHKLRSHGYDVLVIDWFTKLQNCGIDPIETINYYSTKKLRFVFFCSTFLMTVKKTKEQWAEQKLTSLKEKYLDMVSGTMWFQSSQEMTEWFNLLKEKVRMKSPDAKIVIGGGASTRIMHFIPELANYIDLIVSGYGEEAVISLMKNEKIETSVYNGFTYWKVPPNKQPFGAYPFILSKDDKFQPEEVGIIELARGCRFRCKFCSYDNGRSTYLNATELRAILLANYDTYGTTIYHFVDNCINESLEKIKMIHKVAKSLPFNLEWMGYVRPEMYLKNPEMMDLMLESGAGGLFYGVETLNKRAGNLCGKGGNKEKFKQLILDFHKKYKNDVFTSGSFIVGLPGESKSSVLSSMEWVEKEKPFHLSTFSALILPHPDFVNATKSLVFENNGYSMFSTTPERYGITFTNKYKFIGEWRHADMTFDESVQLSLEYTKNMIKTTFAPPKGSFDYLNLRGLGYSKKQILYLANHESPENFEAVYADIITSTNKVLRNYFKDLVQK